jgi:hypothetical protein
MFSDSRAKVGIPERIFNSFGAELDNIVFALALRIQETKADNS